LKPRKFSLIEKTDCQKKTITLYTKGQARTSKPNFMRAGMRFIFPDRMLPVQPTDAKIFYRPVPFESIDAKIFHRPIPLESTDVEIFHRPVPLEPTDAKIFHRPVPLESIDAKIFHRLVRIENGNICSDMNVSERESMGFQALQP
jgi:hypothetical protein